MADDLKNLVDAANGVLNLTSDRMDFDALSRLRHAVRKIEPVVDEAGPRLGILAEPPQVEITLDLDDPEVKDRLRLWGGHTLCRIVIIEDGKRVVSSLSGRISGDTRAGRTDGVHLALSIIRRGSDVVAQRHAKPWLPVCKDHFEAIQEDGTCGRQPCTPRKKKGLGRKTDE